MRDTGFADNEASLSGCDLYIDSTADSAADLTNLTFAPSSTGICELAT